jgi:hypothetical protein
MSVEQSLGDTVGIVFLVVDVLMVIAMFARPQQDRIFECSGAEYQGEQSNRPMRLERQVRKKPVITERNRKANHTEHHKEQNNLEPIESEEPEIDRHSGNRKKQRAYEE